MMPPYRLAHLSPDQMLSIESLENEIGVTLIAWEPSGETNRDPVASYMDAEENLVLDALNDTYRTYDPHLLH